MASGPWTDEENDLIVADYFVMLADDIAGRRYSKAEHRRALLPLLNERSEGSVEFRHQNISAALKGLGEDWIPGYKPAFNFQMTLVDAVARWLNLHPDWLGRLPGMRPATGMREAAQIWICPPPTLSNEPPPQELDQMLHIARKFDVAGRDERNRALGRAGRGQCPIPIDTEPLRSSSETDRATLLSLVWTAGASRDTCKPRVSSLFQGASQKSGPEIQPGHNAFTSSARRIFFRSFRETVLSNWASALRFPNPE